MVNILIFLGYLNMADYLQMLTTYFWEIMLIEASKVLRQYVFYLHTK
ncbi:unnamed protein product [Linum tenue]|uniref:Uncharacterized protein n=1 Tax=Linum tenue TaxID=586396 RepID=A0AAV0H012_9ROSI|nr:unnamed protein product [Linum tenue]CAI0464816.1 unnamed protein product [Linum tenue]